MGEATGGGTPVATSQLALPADAREAVYGEDGYPGSAANLARLSLDGDNVFADTGGESQLATVTAGARSGYLARLDIPVAGSATGGSTVLP